MKLHEFATLLEEVGLQVQYHSFKKGNAPNPPYIVYTAIKPEMIAGDNRRYYQIDTVLVELVTDSKDLHLEIILESLLDNSELFFEIENETQIETEELFVKSYLVYLY
ncbi:MULTISPECIES: hypothetical protein [unclassified Streptococcus]|uniref:hypothetical protein n=2 Tax=Streptococcus TaxID=1301 RepID=UPI00211AA9D5|nr:MULTISPECIES: hypothetical protein [unclassified Streptococcus]MCQ9211657.1 hypothetical protein [Streptococcus sp. B01]MCQ9215049.1 hypothetical protein [Streptococcus sp. O1]MCQ9215098.1 hypothetical protein [Streptococcus sp. O1]